MRSLQLLTLALLAAAAWADEYNFFYSCDSGIVNCADFPKHYNGDFGMNGQPPLGFDQGVTGGESYSAVVTESNIHGEVIGDLGTFNGNYGFYGFGGTIYPDLGTQGVDGLFLPVDINDNGTYLYDIQLASGNAVFVNHDNLRQLINSPAIAAQFGAQAVGDFDNFAYGLNDQNQILLDLSVYYAPGDVRTVEGVLSPTAVPEPSTLLLLTVGIALLATGHRLGAP